MANNCRTNYDLTTESLYNCSKHQSLYKGIYEDMIQRYGIPIKLLPANIDTGENDEVFGENRKVIFDQAIDIKVFLTTVDKYEGEGDIFDKFGLHFEDEIEVYLDKNTADALDSTIGEGDLVYFPMPDAIFEISFVEREEPFYLLGIQMAYKLKLKKYRKSTEDEFDESGISDVDIMDILNDDSDASGMPDSNVEFENEADNDDSDAPDDDNSIFGNW